MSIAKLLLAAAVLAALTVDPRAAAIGGVHLYQRTLAPVGERVGVRCRFAPTCSRYAEAVIARDGIVRGGIAAIKRIARCGPWTPVQTRDDP